jgi:hypothetical protein
MFIKNKYYRWYYQIIDKARKRGIPEEYFEKHHIIPRCMKGSNNWWNLVNLTFREHFLVHWLLTKMTLEEDRRKLLQAFWRMCCVKPKTNRIVSSWQYALGRSAAREAAWGKYERSPEYRAALSEKYKGKGIVEGPFTEEHKRKIGDSNRGQKRSPETIENNRIAQLKRTDHIGWDHVNIVRKKCFACGEEFSLGMFSRWHGEKCRNGISA